MQKKHSRENEVEGGVGEHRLVDVGRPAVDELTAQLLAVLAFDAAVDPWGQLGTGLFPSLIPTDRPAKAKLVDRLAAPPELVVFGSSRALKIDPAYLQRKLGLRGFNAGVSDGEPEDA